MSKRPVIRRVKHRGVRPQSAWRGEDTDSSRDGRQPLRSWRHRHYSRAYQGLAVGDQAALDGRGGGEA